MSDRITASFDTLLSQASDTADIYLSKAIVEIDTHFGAGYAKQNPNLVAAYMQVASADFTASCNAKVFGSALDRIADSLDGIARSIDDRCEV